MDRRAAGRIKEYVRDGTHLLGVCFGHQAIAKALGGSVKPMEKREIGYRPVEFTEENVLNRGLERFQAPFVSHRDRVTELPARLRSFGKSRDLIYAFRHRRRHVYGIQFHPEYGLETAREIVREKDLAEDRKRRVLESLNAVNHSKAFRPAKIPENFARIPVGRSWRLEST